MVKSNMRVNCVVKDERARLVLGCLVLLIVHNFKSIT